ncbi:MAG: hypothetical protein NC187_08250 [Candidatus Amulumruptor caecigallinarius]|nr:hypothetical protein [Candidatus Amulumruptor caecigallinarius]MCM1397460.1 hypothetical protein [Candidatus Amulumruptor caecigallinarius]MCM1454333.1 hypothetical protein [bacterium]
MNRSREIIEILSDVVAATSAGCSLMFPDGIGGLKRYDCPTINYIFGNAQYVKDRLDELSKTASGNSVKFPLIALMCPFNEQRNTPEYYSKAKVRILIAFATKQQYSNEQRLALSFQNILRPIYNRFMQALREDGRFDFGYNDTIAHEYSENYSYGRYGAHTGTGEEVSEPIDAINISNLELTVKKTNCRTR